MAIKMRILKYTGKAKLASVADLIKAEYSLSANSVDTIPPAYSCQNERIVILVISIKNDADDTLRRFLMELTKARAQNTAIIADGKDTGVGKVIEYLNAAGTKVNSNVLYMNVGMFAGKSLSDDEKSTVLNWTKSIVDELS